MVGAIMASDAGASALKVSPPVVVSTAWKFGLDMPHAVMTLTAVYTVLQITFLLYDRFFKKKD